MNTFLPCCTRASLRYPSVTMFQPMNINFGIMPPLDHRVKGKRNKNAELSARSLAIIDQIKQEVREA